MDDFNEFLGFDWRNFGEISLTTSDIDNEGEKINQPRRFCCPKGIDGDVELPISYSCNIERMFVVAFEDRVAG